MVTIYDIAKICNVSPCTVSKVLNNYSSVSEKTRKKILDTMDQLHYVPNALAKSVSKGKSYNIGILMYTGEDTPFFKQNLYIDLLENVRTYLESQNYDLILVNKNVDGKKESFIDHCRARHIDGLVLFGNMENDEMKELIDSDIPTVGFDYIGDKMSGVSSDNYEKVCELTNHLIELGHRNIVFISGEYNEITKFRIQAFKDTLEKNHIKFDNNMLFEGKYYDMDTTKKLTTQLLQSINRPTAIIYPDDYAALGGLSACNDLNINIPNQLSVVGFDGVDICQFHRPTLKTIKQDTAKIGHALGKKLLEVINGDNPKNELIIIKSTFIKGETTSKPYSIEK